jgi:hypothetical protein
MNSFYVFLATHSGLVWLETFSDLCPACDFKLSFITVLGIPQFLAVSHPLQLISFFPSQHICASHFYFHLFLMLALVTVGVATKLRAQCARPEYLLHSYFLLSFIWTHWYSEACVIQKRRHCTHNEYIVGQKNAFQGGTGCGLSVTILVVFTLSSSE